MSFEKFTETGLGRKRGKRGRPSTIGVLEVDECYAFVGIDINEAYAKVIPMEKRTGKEFSYIKCVNGIAIKRIK